MNTQPLISFIITVCNTDTTLLRECIESITTLSLSREEREIIVVDDGSDMTPLNELDELADEIVYIRQRHSGLSAARNTGLKMASGRFIQLAEGGALFIRAPYEHCLDIARYHNPDIVYFKTTAKDSDIDTPFTYEGPVSGSEYMRGNNIRGAAYGYIFERAILGKLRFSTGNANEDEEFTPQLFLRSERFYTTDSEAYCCRDSHTADSTDNGHDSDFADTERTLIHLQQLVVPEADRAALNRRIAQLTMDYLCDVIRRTHDYTLFRTTTERLRANGLYPLPDRDYTMRYKYFRKMIGNAVTRRLLFSLIARR